MASIGAELVDARVVDKDVETTEVFDGSVDEAFGFRSLGYVSADGDGLATCLGDCANDGIGTGLARCVVDDDGGAFGGERFSNGGSDSLGSAGDDCDFSCELAHISISIPFLNFESLRSCCATLLRISFR